MAEAFSFLGGLVNKVATTLQTSLVRSLYSPSLVNDLLSETEEDQMRREKLREVLRLMEQAMATIRDVQAGRGLETRETKTR